MVRRLFAAVVLLFVPSLAHAQLFGSVPSFQNVQSFTGNGTWTKPTFCASTACSVHIRLIGSGGSGGGGASETAGTVGSGGGAGGAGACIDVWDSASSFTSTVTVTIGAGQTGGNGAASAGPGSDGTQGQNTTFGTYYTA